MNLILISAISLGLLSSFHCLGMCGPIAMAVPSRRTSWAGRTADGLLLNAGRISTYAFLGALFGIFGRGLQLAGLQQSISLALGVLILVGLLWPALIRGHVITGRLALLTGRAQHALARSLGRTSPLGLLSTGMLNGLLPCGLVYLALAASLMQDNAWRGAAFMAAFGLGTVPALLALRLGTSWFTGSTKAFLRRLSPYLVAAVGVLFVLRGMGLGIPYVSPMLHDVPTGVLTCHGSDH